MLDGSDAERRDLAPQGVELRKALAELRLGGVLPDGPPHLGRYDADCFVLRWPGWEGFVRHGIDGVFSLAFHERGYMCDGRIELSRHDGETYQSVGHYGTLMLACIDRIDQLDDGSLSDTRRYVDGVLWTKPQSGFINASQALGLVQQIESVAAASCAPFLRVGTRDFWVARHMADRGASIEVSVMPTFEATRQGPHWFGLLPSDERDADTQRLLVDTIRVGDVDLFTLLNKNLQATPGRANAPETGGVIKIQLKRAFDFGDPSADE